MADKTDTGDRVVPIKAKKCPLCAKPQQERFRPFCSKRCSDLDLGAWLNESYRIPAEEEGAVDDDYGDEN